MSTTTKNPICLARAALQAGEKAFEPYSHPKSPHKFTQPQLAACLVVKEFLRLDYRGVSVLLAEWSDLREVLDLRRVPHFTTLVRRLLRILTPSEA